MLVKPGALAEAPAPAAGPRRRKGDGEQKKRGGGSAVVVFLSGGLGFLVVLAGLAATGWFLFTQVDTEPSYNSAFKRRCSGAGR